MNDILIQIIGYVGLLFYLVSFQIKSNKKFFILQFIGAIIFSVQFFLLGAFSGCLSLIVNMARGLLLSKANEVKWVRSKWVLAVLLLAYTVAISLTWEGPISILCLVASLVSTTFYFTNNAKNIRLANLFISAPCWLTYDIIIKSWGGVITESLCIISVIVSIIKFGWDELGNPDSEINKN